MLTWLLEIDNWLFSLINGTWHNATFDAVLPLLRNRSFWIPIYVLLAALLIWKYKLKAIYIFLLIAVTVLITDQISSELLKKTIQRLRPCNNPDIQAQIRILVNCGSGFSFTSSHAANHFALAYLFGAIFTPFIPTRWNFSFSFLCYLWAFSIAYAQVYVGVHFPLDVFCGALLGIGVAALTSNLYKYLKNKWLNSVLP